MQERNLILTDIMKTGDNQSYEQFINKHSLTGQEFDMTGEFYTLHSYKFNLYTRKFAILDMRIHNDRLNGNLHYIQDLNYRLHYLHNHGFKLIIGNPWESYHNIDTQVFMANKKLQKINIPFEYFTWVGGVSWFWNLMQDKHSKHKFVFNHLNKKYNFLFLNKFPRQHRLQLFQRMKDNNLLDKSLYTFLGLKENPIRLPEEYELPWCKPEDYPLWGLDQDLYEKPYNDTGCSLISETNDTNDEVFITEKLWKPIISKHIFIVHGNYHYLKTLKKIGFKTFDNFFDESYDNHADKNKRIESIIDLCKKLKDTDWKKLYTSTEAIREHNYETFFDKAKLQKVINKELSRWLEFFDSSQVSTRKS